jgi:hypothetical protein
VSTLVADDLRADLLQQVRQLADLWSGLALRHVSLGGACGCGGGGGVSLRLEDFELDIVDYLHDAAARCDESVVARWGESSQQAVASLGEVVRMRDLFEALEAPQTPEAVLTWLLPRLERTLRSYAELHAAS